MSVPEELATQLDAAIYGLHDIRLLVSDGGRGAFDASEDKLALDLLWETSARETPVLFRILERLHDQLGTNGLGARAVDRVSRRQKCRSPDPERLINAS